MNAPVVGVGQSEKQTPYIYIEGDITHVQSGTTPEGEIVWDNTGRVERRTVFLYLSDAAFQYSADKLDALGWNGDFQNPVLANDAAQGIHVECTQETYEGKLRDRFNLPGKGIDHKPVDANTLRKINAMYRQRKVAAKAPPKKPSTQPVPAGAVDPIPFE